MSVFNQNLPMIVAADSNFLDSRINQVNQKLASSPEPTTLFEHQKDAVKFMLDREFDDDYKGGIIADEVGIGKTIQAIATILANRVNKTLIVMPSQLLNQWLKSFNKWAPELDVYIAHGKGKLKSRKDINSEKFISADVVLTSYGMTFKRKGVNDDYKTLLHEVHWDRVILDEAHSIASGSVRSRGRAAFGLAKVSNIRWALTATPIVNRENDILSLLRFIGEENLIKLYKSDPASTIKKFLCRRTKIELAKKGIKEMELPGLTTEIIPVEWMSQEEAHFYHVVQGDVRNELERMVKFNRINITEILELLCRLKQASVHPQMVINSQRKKNNDLDIPDWLGKCTKIEALVNDILQHKEDSVIFTEFTLEAESISKRLIESGLDVEIYNGSTSKSKRLEILNGADIPNSYAKSLAEINYFNKYFLPEDICLNILSFLPQKILVVNKKSCGVGLNLQRFSRSYELIPSWSPAEEEQAIGRSYRLGQTKPVVFKKFVLKDPNTRTIDNRILKLQNEKRLLMAELLKDESLRYNGSLGKTFNMKLTQEDIINLIS